MSTCLIDRQCLSRQKKKGSFSVSGTFKNADKLAAVEGPISKVYLLEVANGKDQPVILDSAKVPRKQWKLRPVRHCKGAGNI